MYQDWRKRIPHDLMLAFKLLTTAVENWQHEIFAYFSVASASATNATTEALNGIAKLANRTGRGYSFEAVRVKLLYAKQPTHSFRSYLTSPNQRDMGVRIAEIARLIDQYELVSAELERLRREAES